MRGLFLQKSRNKVEKLNDMAKESNAPWIALTETWLNPDIIDAEVQIPGRTLFRADREGRTHGGCALYIRDDLTSEIVTAHSNKACDTLIVKIKTLNLLVIVNYRPPDTKEEEFAEQLEVCQEAIDKITNKDPKVKDIFQIGDFNMKCISWPSRKIYSRDVENKATEKVQAEMLLRYAEKNFLENIVTTPTRGNNILDLCFTNNHTLINYYKTTVNSRFSDHNTIETDLNFSYNIEVKKEKKVNPYKTKVYEYETENADEEDWLRWQKLLDDVNIENEFGGPENTETKVSKFFTLIESLTALVFKKKKSFQDLEEREKGENKKQTNNKIPKRIRQLMKRQSKLSKQVFSSTNWEKNYDKMEELREIEKELEESYKNRRIKKENEAIKSLMKNPKFFYSYQRHFSKTNEKMSGFVTENDEIVKDPFKQAEMLREQYQSVYSQPDEAYSVGANFFLRCENCALQRVHECGEDVWNYPEGELRSPGSCSHRTAPTAPGQESGREQEQGEQEEQEGQEQETRGRNECSDCKIYKIAGLGPDDLDNPHFDWLDFSLAIDALSSSAAPGPDGVPAVMIKKGKNSISRILYEIFKTSFDNGEIPEVFKKAFIIPIHKGGSKAAPAQYRPVSLTSHLVKTFERVLVKKLVAYLEFHGRMDPRQHGSRVGRSTLSQLLTHQDQILQALEDGDNIDAIYLDFAKAFDKVDQGLLLHKLKALGVKGKMGRWIQKFLTGRTQQVLVDGKMSSIFLLLSGVPQGSVLGPILFLIFIADIGEDLEAETFVYVDDTKTLKRIKTEKDVENHQEDIVKLFKWGEDNNMKYNGDKFVAIRYGSNTQIKENTIYLTGDFEEVIEEKQSTRDLGIIMQNDATFNEHIEKVCKQVRQKTGWLYRSFYSRNMWFLRHMWNSLIQPKLDYCSQLWFPEEGVQLEKLEKLMKDFTSRIPAIQGLTYWERLRKIKMNSEQRRMERYNIIYVWKTMKGLVPNSGVTLTSEDDRQGRRCAIPKLKTKERTKREHSFQVKAARLFNCLPRELRELKDCGLEDFKVKLDIYLTKVPDEPKIGGLMPLNFQRSNSLLHQVARRS